MRFRMPISAVMAVVALVAVDLTIVGTGLNGDAMFFFVVGVLPMANLLALVGLSAARRLWRREPAPARIGFLLAGCAAVSLVVACLGFDQSMIYRLPSMVDSVVRPLEAHVPRGVLFVVWLAMFLLPVGLPQLVFALFGAWVSRGLARRESSWARRPRAACVVSVLGVLVVSTMLVGLVRLRWRYLADEAFPFAQQEQLDRGAESHHRLVARNADKLYKGELAREADVKARYNQTIDSSSYWLAERQKHTKEADEWSRKANEAARIHREYLRRWW